MRKHNKTQLEHTLGYLYRIDNFFVRIKITTTRIKLYPLTTTTITACISCTGLRSTTKKTTKEYEKKQSVTDFKKK